MNHRSPDLLSGLPLGIIHIILSLLPIRDAIRTSFLSKQWRYIWASLPDLVFDKKCVNPPVRYKSDFKRLGHFISQALFIHKGPIHKFELRSETRVQSQYMDQWLLFLSRNDIRILVLDSLCDECIHLHSSLYSCQYLTHMELGCLKIPPPPESFKGFLWLRSLNLYIVGVSSTTIESIVARSPLLEELILDSCKGWDLTLHSPSLKYFHFNSSCEKLSLGTPLLEELAGDFAGIQSWQELSLVFPHLRIVKLSGVAFYEEDVALAVIQLITSSPNLQKLEISDSSCWTDACASLWDAKSAPDFTYNNLKVIKMEKCCGALDEMKLIRFLLERSPVLKVINMENLCVPAQDLPNSLNLMAELLSFRRASTNAQILIGGGLMRSF